MHFLDLIFPKFCIGCGKWGAYICASCKRTLKLLPYLKCPVCEKPAVAGMTHPRCQTKYSLDGLTSFFRYDGVVKTAIKKIKYGRASDISGELVGCIPDSSLLTIQQLRTTNHELRTLSLVPIPLHRSRFNDRGFNQAEKIARELGKKLDIPVNTQLLIRTKKTTPQVEMKDRVKRLANMKDVFSVRNNVSILRCNDLAIFLIDDVFTTGATLHSAASVLKHAGAPFVWGLTIAQ